MAKTVIGLFHNEREAQAALRDLANAGFSGDQVSYVDRESNRLADNLAAAGIPQADALIYADGLKRGGVLIVLQALPDAAARQAVELLYRYPLVDIDAGSGAVGERSINGPAPGRSADLGRFRGLYQGVEAVIPIVGEEQVDDQAPDLDPFRDVREHPAKSNY